MSFMREVRTRVAVSRQAVFDYVSDVGRHGEWAGDKLTVRAVAAGGWESIVDLGMAKPTATISVECADPPRSFAYVCDDQLSGRYRWTFTLRPVEGGTEITHRVERLQAPGWVRVLQPWFMWPVAGRPGAVRGLKNLRRRLEAPQPEPAT